jgi:tetratricopeptide (TPR) repeat protein
LKINIGNWQGRFLTSCLLLSVIGCAAVPQTLQLSREPGNLPRRILLDEVAFFPQVKYQCGPAALATVLNYSNVDVVPDNLIDKVFIPERNGSLQIEMVATARSYGKLTYPLEKHLKALLTELAAGNPVLVFQNLALSIWPQWHYAVAVGYDLDSAELILRSGTYRQHRLSLATFERTWQRGGYWAYMVLPAGEIPATARPKDYLLATYDLERAGFKQLALKSYRSAADNWPESPATLMALGNSEYSMGYMAEAQSVFTRVIQQKPENAAAWNNLAYALAGGGCHQDAVSAVQCASQLAPTDTNIKHSLSEISAMDNTGGESCQVLSCPIELTDQ